MKFTDLQQLMKGRPYFRFDDLAKRGVPLAHEKVQLSHWVKEGKLVRLKRGLYVLSALHAPQPPVALGLAEPLYRPSYLSLEFALSHYGLLPEAVGQFTSVSTRKTAHFRNALGDFQYRHLQPKYFFGFHRRTDPVLHWMADAEKALLDFIYLSIPKKSPLNAKLFSENYRFQNLDVLSPNRLRESIDRFNHPRVQEGGRLVLALLTKKGKQS